MPDDADRAADRRRTEEESRDEIGPLLVAHTSRRRDHRRWPPQAADQLRAAGFEVRMLPERGCRLPGHAGSGGRRGAEAALGCELVIALGGDGTFLRAAELARPAGVPMLGVNLGHVGFLAEAEPAKLDDTVAALTEGRLRRSRSG